MTMIIVWRLTTMMTNHDDGKFGKKKITMITTIIKIINNCLQPLMMMMIIITRATKVTTTMKTFIINNKNNTNTNNDINHTNDKSYPMPSARLTVPTSSSSGPLKPISASPPAQGPQSGEEEWRNTKEERRNTKKKRRKEKKRKSETSRRNAGLSQSWHEAMPSGGWGVRACGGDACWVAATCLNPRTHAHSQLHGSRASTPSPPAEEHEGT